MHGPSNRQRPPRVLSDNPPPRVREQPEQQGGVYRLQQRDRSYETVASAAASNSTDQAGYQTDPTSGSDNSSIERGTPAAVKPSATVGDYGIGFSQTSDKIADVGAPPSAPPKQSPLASPAPAAPAQVPVPMEQATPAPAPPAKESPANRLSLLKRIPTNASSGDSEKKRSSWLKRRFSKKAVA
jgi:hypothetical protein